MTGAPHSPQFKPRTFPSWDLVPAACSEIAQGLTGGVPDAASLTILVPDLHAVPAVARALHAAFAVPVLVLPRIVTLRTWAEEFAIDEEFVAPAQREVHLYRALAERNWLAGADLWAVAAELAGVFDELSRWHVRLPASVNDFQAQLEAAYRARAGASFGFEARLIHELWHASHAPGILDAETAYGLRLMRLAQQVAAPIHALGLSRLAPVEEDFLCRCAERVVVTRYAFDRDAPASALEHFLAQAWPQDPRCDIYERAEELRATVTSSPLKGRLNFFGATSAEEEAQAVDTAVRRWLRAGRTRIGVVIFDRVVARRARALLERAEVLVRDEAGWPLSTTSAATVIARWLDAVSNDFYYRDCLDLLKSPFVLHDQPREERQQVVWRLERALRATNVHSGITQFLRLAEEAGDRALSELLKRLVRAEQLFARNRRKTMRAWIDALQRSLAEIGVYAGLAADAAGIELLELLDALRADLDSDVLRLEFGEWRRWLSRKLEGAAFRDRSIDSPIVFTTLAATRLRAFDAAIILGADVHHLPGSEPAGSLFNQSVRRELGLPVRADDIRRTEEELSALLAGCDDVLVTWQRMRDAEENLLSPLLERLTVLHGLAWKEDLQDDSLRAAITSAALTTHRSELPPATARPHPRITAALLPETISASAYNSLLACPYQFHARYVLGLAKIDEVQEEIDKADYGTRVHDVLSEFHRVCPLVSELEPHVAQQRLDDISRQAFQELIAHDYQASAWLARWLALVPQYLDWQREREAAGWRFTAAEADRTLTIATPGGHSFVLRGRIDRVDTRDDGAIAVVDYKTRPVQPLRRSLSTPGEDVQLPAYALLWGGEVAAAFFLSLDRDGASQVDLVADVDALARATRLRLAKIYDEIAAGAPLPAQGAEEVCGYCTVRGLCRKNFWP